MGHIFYIKMASREHVHLGEYSKIWNNCNIYGTKEEPIIIGENTQIGANCEIKPGVHIGNNCRIQNGVFIPEGVTIDDYVFIGPHVVFTNDKYPTAVSAINGTWKRLESCVGEYTSIGANAVIMPGVEIREYCQIGAGAIVTKNVDIYSIVAGNPAKKIGDLRKKPYKKIFEELLLHEAP